MFKTFGRADVGVVLVVFYYLNHRPSAGIRIRENHKNLTIQIRYRSHCLVHLERRIARFKIPRYVMFVTEFPITISGKIQKFKMREESIKFLGLEDASKIQTA